MSKVILITGTSSGFGKLTAISAARQGHTVYASMRNVQGRNASAAQELKAEPGIQVLEVDVTSQVSVDAAVKSILDNEGRLDILVNNAGIGAAGYTEAHSTDNFQKVFDVNVFGVQRAMQAALPTMRQHKSGLIINISSVMGILVLPFAGAYTASKWALEGLTESYRYELARSGVDAVIVQPGGFGTSFFGNMLHPDQERMATYGDLAEVPNQMWSGVGARVQEHAPDPQLVADAVLDLIQMPAGTRPLRTVVDPLSGGEGAKMLNDAHKTVQAGLLANFQLAEGVAPD